MACASCGTDNPPGAAFCMLCGAAQIATCANCSVELPAGAAFCPTCGTPVANEVADDGGLRRLVPPELLSKLEFVAKSGGMQGERRTVTILFCDIQGSTAAAETMDPEEWTEVMNGAFEHLIAPVYRYEGTLGRLMGDAILAFFGAPIGHEDDPERAILAGLEIVETFRGYRDHARRTWGIEVDVRVGINTGLVVVGAVGSDLRVEYTAMGDVVNVAARMEQTAAPSTVQVAASTKRLVERLFAFEDLGGIEVRGKAEPVSAFRVEGVLPRPETTRGVEGLSSPLVGRDDELAAILDVLESARSGAGAVVSVIAEAGLGKSRLVTEARGRLLEDFDDVAWHEGRSLSFETTMPYAPIRRMLQSLTGLEGGEASAEKWRRVEHTVMGALPGRSAEITPFLAMILDVVIPDEHSHRVNYLEPPERRAEAFRAIREFVAALAQAGPLVLVFEDLHWADEASLEVVRHLLSITDTVGALVIVLLFRPRREEGSWQVHETVTREYPHRLTVIELKPLGDSDARMLVANLLAIDGLPDAVRDRILTRSEGNPFFVEEIIRSMIDQEMVEHDGQRWVATGAVGEMKVPNSVAAVLTTRLDALDEDVRQIAQAASVIGRQFRYDELATCVSAVDGLDRGLVELQRRELVREVARIPKRLYRFRHALVQEAVYATLLRKQRIQYHAAIAEFIERTQPERAEDLAHHFSGAHLGARALPYLVEAGERAAAAYAIGPARERFEGAVALIDAATPGDIVRRALEGLGGVRQFIFDMEGAAEVYRRLEAEGEQRDDQGMVVSALNKLGLIRAAFFAELDEGLVDLKRSEEMARSLAIDDGLAEACIHQCMVRSTIADFEQVEYYMSELQRLGERTGQPEPTLFGMTHLANTFAYLTRFDDSIQTAEKALARAEELGNLKFQAELLTFSLPMSHISQGRAEQASVALERGMEVAQQIGDQMSVGQAALLQGRIAMERGHLEQALALFRRATAAFDRTGVPYMQALGRCLTGTCYRTIGGAMLSTATEYHARTLELVAMPTGSVHGAWVWTEIGHCALAVGDVDRASAMFTLALEEKTAPMHLMRPLALVGAAEVALAENRLADARNLVDEALAYVEVRGMQDQRPVTLLTSARVAVAEGDLASADGLLEGALAAVEALGMRRLTLDVLAVQSRVFAAQGRDEDAATARALLKEIADSIGAELTDPDVRSAFVDGVATLLAT